MNYFITTGSGESDLKSSHNETGSFDAALVNAGLTNVNLVYYSSMIPKKSKEIIKPNLEWGKVIGSIVSQNDGTPGQTISVGLLIKSRK